MYIGIGLQPPQGMDAFFRLWEAAVDVAWGGWNYDCSFNSVPADLRLLPLNCD
jgi:hypothetical protein